MGLLIAEELLVEELVEVEMNQIYVKGILVMVQLLVAASYVLVQQQRISVMHLQGQLVLAKNALNQQIYHHVEEIQMLVLVALVTP